MRPSRKRLASSGFAIFCVSALRLSNAQAATVIVNVNSVSGLYSAFSTADSNINNTYEIHLAPRTYTLLRPAANDPGDRNSRTTGSLKLRSGHVRIIGAGGDENLAGNYVLDGGRVGTSTGTSIFNISPLSLPSSFRPSLDVRGVVIQNAFSSAALAPIDVAGGVLTLVSCHLMNNQSQNTPGGALYAASSTVTIANTFFDGSVLSDAVGSVVCGGGVFGSGGAIYLASSSADISYSTIQGGIACRGGGIFFSGSSTNTLNIRNSTILQNSAVTSGGGIYLGGSGNVILLFDTIGNNLADSVPSGDLAVELPWIISTGRSRWREISSPKTRSPFHSSTATRLFQPRIAGSTVPWRCRDSI